MKRSERLKQLAEEMAKELRKKIAQERLIQEGETTEVSISISVKAVLIPISCTIDDHDKEAVVTQKTQDEEVPPRLVNQPLQNFDDPQTSIPTKPSIDRIIRSQAFTVVEGDPALGKFCQECAAKIRIGDRVIERIPHSLTAKQDVLFYVHLPGGCDNASTNSDFGNNTGGGTRVIRSTRNLGG